MIEIGSETYYFDWDVFRYVLIGMGLFVSLLAVLSFKFHLKIISKARRLFLVFGIMSIVTGLMISVLPEDPYEKFVSYDEMIESLRTCDVSTDCVVVDKCDKVQAVNKRFEQEYINELLKSSYVYLVGCLKGEPDSRRAVYSAECVRSKCKEIVVKPSSMHEVEDRLNGKFDP